MTPQVDASPASPVHGDPVAAREPLSASERHDPASPLDAPPATRARLPRGPVMKQMRRAYP